METLRGAMLLLSYLPLKMSFKLISYFHWQITHSQANRFHIVVIFMFTHLTKYLQRSKV